MTKKMLSLALMLLLMAALPLAHAQKGGNKGGGGAVTAEFRDPGRGADGDRLDSDGGGPYVDSQDNVSLTIQNDTHRGDVVLNTERSRGVRTLFFEFAPSDCTLTDNSGNLACGTAPFFWGTPEKAVLQTRQADLRLMAVGESKPVKLHIWFQAPDPMQNGKVTGWFVRFDPEDADSNPLGCHSAYANVTRTSASPAVWVLEAGANVDACLMVQTRTGKQVRGRYRMPFQMILRQ